MIVFCESFDVGVHSVERSSPGLRPEGKFVAVVLIMSTLSSFWQKSTCKIRQQHGL